MEKVCVICEASFTTANGTIATCGRSCGYQLVRRKSAETRARNSILPTGVIERRPADRRGQPPVIKTCAVCGSRFAVSPYSVAAIVTCSRACSSLHRQGPRLPGAPTFCEECRRPMKPKHKGNAGVRRFCSNECRLRALQRAHKTAIPHFCLRCGKPQPYSATRQYCSRQCMWEDRSYLQRRLAKTRVSAAERRAVAALISHRIECLPSRIVGSRILDAYLPAYNVDLEIDGYWHTKGDAQERDRRRDQEMTQRGLTVIRLPASLFRTEHAADEAATWLVRELKADRWSVDLRRYITGHPQGQSAL